MSLYDDLDDKKSENVAGWASGIKFLQNHMHLKKATTALPKRDQVRKSASLVPVIDLKKSKLLSGIKDEYESSGSGSGGGGSGSSGVTPSFILPYSVTTTVAVKDSKKNKSKYKTSHSPYLSVDSPWQIEGEYDPMCPNEYEKALKELRDRRDKEAEEEEIKRKTQEENREEDEFYPPPPSKSSLQGVAIAPPPSLSYGAGDRDRDRDRDRDYDPMDMMMMDRDRAEMGGLGLGHGGKMGGGNFGLGKGTGANAAARIMAKYGYKEGQGLGKKEQGMATALQVEKISHRTGRIIHEKDEPKGILLNAGSGGMPFGGNSPMVPLALSQYNDDEDIIEPETEDMLKTPPSRVILLKNMVGPGEVDDDLEPEVKDECNSKYGDVENVTVFQMPDLDGDDAIRIFVEFTRVESANKALMDLNGRFFGGRQVKALFYDYDKYTNLELTD